ncbi:HD domain-containing protein [Acinetobacter sp.]|uniref:HD domain-containing protein n=1 Tax=Acinetobacter sp. TaxID=472 RepID=UPI003750AB91
MSLLIKAAQFANVAHAGQWRKHTAHGIRIPYIHHVSRVAGRVALLPDVTEDMIAAAWLHDVIEDCGITEAMIAHLFNEIIARYVIGLTSYTKRPNLREHWKSQNRKTRVDANNSAYEVEPLEVHRMKYCDRLDNLTDTLNHAEPDFALRYVEETDDLGKYLDPKCSGLVFEMHELLNAIKLKYSPITKLV